MKKLIIATIAIVASIMANAASVDWRVTGDNATKGYMVYVLTSVAESYDSVTDIAKASVGSGTIATVGRSTYAGGTAAGDAVTKTATYYYAIVSGEDATSFNYVEASGMAAKVYDPAAQESSSGAFSTISAANILAGAQGTIGSVPEPTSGLLLLLGMAGLALRRKQK